MTTRDATVSLYIPCRNAENHIERTLESVFTQTYPITEIIAVDDGSTDKTTEIVQRFPVDLVRHPRTMGITATRNTAIQAAKGEIVASVDADVTLEGQWLERVMNNFADPQVGGVGGRIIERNTDPIVGQWLLAHRDPDRGQRRIENVPCLPGGAVAYQRKVLFEVGGYQDDKRYDHSDLDLSLRVKMIGYRLTYESDAICYHHFQGDTRTLFDGPWNFRKDAYVNCGLFTNPFGLRRKIEINLGEFYQMLMDDFNARRHAIMHLNIIGALRHCLMDVRLYYQLNPENGRRSDLDTFRALKLGLLYLLRQKKEIASSLMADILNEVLDICMESGRENNTSHTAEKAGDIDLLSGIKSRFPRADLKRVSDWLVMFLGFLNSLRCEVWENMNRSTREKRSITR